MQNEFAKCEIKTSAFSGRKPRAGNYWVRSKIRHILSNYNADRKDLFSANCGPAYLKEVRLSDVDRFVMGAIGLATKRRFV